MSVVENLKKVKELLSDKTKWTQGHFARRADGEATWPVSKDAVCFCLIGATEKVVGASPGFFESVFDTEESTLLTKASTALFGINVPYVNDNLGYEAVTQVIDKSIEMAKEAEKVKYETR